MSLSKEQIAEFRAQVGAANDAVALELKPLVEQLAELLSQVIVTADRIEVVDVNTDHLRIRDVTLTACAQCKINLDNSVRPLLAKLAPPAETPPAA